ncbi:MAG: monophosphatase [Acidimicrobiaceae bacterium]|nr:monophosphatase [Acidimicrobiaceae bacterium]
MEGSEEARAPDWLGACQRMTAGMREMFALHPTTAQRAVETGRGEGGDEALVIDRAAEDVVFAELDTLHRAGHRFAAISEERGTVDYGAAQPLVVIDPIDGSLNAKRGMTHFSLSVAVADGPTMADVFFGYVYDFGAREEWTARRGDGAELDGRPLDAERAERRTRDGVLEMLAIESADPRYVLDCAPRLLGLADRLRAIGSIAISLCQLAAGRVDGMLTLWRCRSVDAAAAQLIVREAGGFVAFTAFDDPLAAPLDLAPHSPVVAARSAAALAELARVPSS